MSKIPIINIVGTGNLTPNQFLENDLDFLAMMGYNDTNFNQTGKNINSNITTALSNYNYTSNSVSNVLTYSQVKVSNTTTTATYQGQYNIDYKLADNGIYDNTNPTFSNSYVSVPPSMIHYNVLKYRTVYYVNDLVQNIF